LSFAVATGFRSSNTAQFAHHPLVRRCHQIEFPQYYRNIWNNRSTAKGTPQLWESLSYLGSFRHLINFIAGFGLQSAVLCFRQRFLDNLALNVFASRFSFGQFTRYQALPGNAYPEALPP
jgi:hypothetical protein